MCLQTTPLVHVLTISFLSNSTLYQLFLRNVSIDSLIHTYTVPYLLLIHESLGKLFKRAKMALDRSLEFFR